MSKANKAYVYRLYPNKAQKILINKTIGCARLVYNLLLSDRMAYYKECHQTLKREVSYYKRMPEYDFLKEVDSLALANAKRNLEAAYKNFFEGNARFPKFKKKGRNDTYTTNRIVDKNGHENICITDGKIKLPKLGCVRTKHRRFPEADENIKSVTISEKAGKYYASVLVEYECDFSEQSIEGITLEDCIGLDYSSPHFYVDSNGDTAGYPQYYRKSEERLAREQRRLSRKKKGSGRRERQKLKVQRISRHIADQRKDFAHKKSAELVSRYKVICLEDISLSAIMKGMNLGKSTSDNGFGMFRDFCTYKAERSGGYVVKVDRFYPSSQLCSSCGHKNPAVKDLSVREWVCPACGAVHNRDHNSAINIRNEGYRMLMAQ